MERVSVQFISDMKTGDFRLKQNCALTHLKFSYKFSVMNY